MAFSSKPKQPLLSLLCFLILLLCSAVVVVAHGDSTVCSAVYKLGGSLALMNSPECSYWKLPDHEASTTKFCQTATLQGRQKHQGDRVLCSLDLSLPFPSKKGSEYVKVGVAAVFDGRNGSEASEMASESFLDYFSLHVNLLAQEKRITSSLKESFHTEVLKEALKRTINDIDAVLTAEANTRNLSSSSTATVALIVDRQIVVANAGDSKAFLCSKKALSPIEAAKESLFRRFKERKSTPIVVKDQTKHHHSDREGKISPSIGAVSNERVISMPEVADWQKLTAEDRYLVAASDGVFEKMSLEEVCDLVWEDDQEVSMVNGLVNTAFEKGSVDNLAAVIVPLHYNFSPSKAREEDAYQRISRFDEL